MARRFHPRSTPADNMRLITRGFPWKLLLLLPVLAAVAIPTYLFGSRLGNQVLPSVTKLFSALAAPAPSATPTPPPAFPTLLPRAGTILYTAQVGDSCDSILTFQMRMNDAGQVFSEVKPTTVKALNDTLGKNCLDLQPGMVLPLSPHYPLVAFGGVVLKIESSTPQQVLPTPLINVPTEQTGPDCSGGCNLTVRLTPNVQIHLLVQTTLYLHIGTWIWAQAMPARKAVPGFDNYPYVDPNMSLNGMSLRACDFQVGTIHDDNSLSCDQLTPNTIDDDNGSWLLGVTGSSALDHWGYKLKLPAGTQVLLWLTAQNGNLKFQSGNPVYRYDTNSGHYVKV